jgi:hypothetical protein
MTEEGQQSTVSNENTTESRTKVGFPQAPEKHRKFPWKIVFIALIVILLGLGVFWVLSGNANEKLVSDIATTSEVNTDDNPTSTPVPTISTIDKKDVKFQVLNGTGVTGAAGTLQKELQKIGFQNVDTGNADTTDHTTTEISFGNNLSDDIKTEVMDKLQGIYTRVTSKDATQTNYDIQITTGTLKGQVITPTGTLMPSVTPTTSITPASTL